MLAENRFASRTELWANRFFGAERVCQIFRLQRGLIVCGRGVQWATAQRPAHQLPRARHNERVKKPTISRAKRSAAWACSVLRSLSFGLRVACADHTGTELRRHNGAQSVPPPAHDHAQHNRLQSVPPPAHNHAAQNRHAAQRACVPHRAARAICTTSVRTTPCTTSTCTPELAQRAFWKRNSPRHYRKGLVTTLPGRRTSWHSVAASALHKASSKTQRSRARSGQLQCRVSPQAIGTRQCYFW